MTDVDLNKGICRYGWVYYSGDTFKEVDIMGTMKYNDLQFMIVLLEHECIRKNAAIAAFGDIITEGRTVSTRTELAILSGMVAEKNCLEEQIQNLRRNLE
jgi:hypothetical protein